MERALLNFVRYWQIWTLTQLIGPFVLVMSSKGNGFQCEILGIRDDGVYYVKYLHAR